MSKSTLLRAITTLLAVCAPGLASANNIVGVAEIIDGDSFSVGGAEVRLFGVDAPEYDQTCFSDGSSIPCGALAKEALEGLAGSETLACVPIDTDTFGRAVARCTNSGVDVGEALESRDGPQRSGAIAMNMLESRRAPVSCWSVAMEVSDPRGV